jgi:metal transporter CNNM
VAVVVSTTLITIFGEILPQAIFYQHALKVGYYFVPVVRFFQIIFYPIAKPIAFVLDKILGKEKETLLSKEEISEMIKTHEDSNDSEIDSDEESIVLGALSFSEKKVNQIMTPKKVVFALEENEILDEGKRVEIKKTGFSRIPVYHENIDEMTGVLFAKDLINIDSDKKVYDLYRRNRIFKVNENDNLDDLLNKFIKKKSHIAYVTNSYDTFLGIVTMEDLIEEIIQKEIVDETDKYVDMREEAKNEQSKLNKKK